MAEGALPVIELFLNPRDLGLVDFFEVLSNELLFS